MAEEDFEEEKESGFHPLAFLTIIRPINCLMATFAVYVATLVAGLVIIPEFAVLLALLSVFLICAGGMVINDYFDVEIDKINKPDRPIPSGKISKNVALVYSLILFSSGVAASYFINQPAMYVASAAAFILILYAAKLKKVLFLGNVAVSALVALTFIYGGLINMNYIPVASLAALAFLANLAREVYKSVDDILGDEENDVASLATKYGVNKARTIAAAFILLAIMLSFLPFGLNVFNNGIIYMFFVLIADMLFLISIVFHKKAAKIIKFGMLIALVSFLVGALA
jgi:geranylgeranylglycerol-phosphate geranylgeranyltransferase